MIFLCLVTKLLHLTEQVIMEIPLELMLTIRQKQPWMFFPDIVPIGHPIFDIINSTNPEVTEIFLDFEHLFILEELCIPYSIW